jgi:hypothetical protein
VKRAGDGLRWEAGPAAYGGALEHLSYDTFLLKFPPGRIALPSQVTFTIDPRGVPRRLECDVLGTMDRVGP